MGNFVRIDEVGPVLYRSWAGFDVHRFSYTLANDISTCGEKTKLSRFQGLTKKTESASFRFGICIEDSIKDFYLLGEDLYQGFKVRWDEYQDKELEYTKTDQSWENLNLVGKALMHQFEFDCPEFPIVNPEFGVVVPRDPTQTWHNGTRLEYIADCISHPLSGDILIDFKTAGKTYPEGNDPDSPTFGYPALDPQLRTGALASGISQVAFLVLVKGKVPKIQFHVGHVTEKHLADTDAWLKEQYEKLVSRNLHMRTGVRWPDDHCLHCQFLLCCLGREEEAMMSLRHKESKETSDAAALLDEE